MGGGGGVVVVVVGLVVGPCRLAGSSVRPHSKGLIGPKKGINKDNKDFSLFVLYNSRFYYICFCFFPGVLEGLESSGRLIGSFSTYSGTCKCPWSRVIAKNPPGGFFLPSTVY